MNVLHFQKSASWSENDLSTLLDEISQAWEAQFSPLQSNLVEMTRIILTNIEEPDSFQVDRAPTTDLTGGRTSIAMPQNVTVATKFTTGLSGRSHRGRSFHIGLTDDQCVNDFLVAGMADTIRDAWIDFAGAIFDSPLIAALVVVSFCQDKEWLDEAEVTPITGFLTDGTLDSMRNRLSGRGI